MVTTPEEKFVRDRLEDAARENEGNAYHPHVPSDVFLAKAHAIRTYLRTGAQGLTLEEIQYVEDALIQVPTVDRIRVGEDANEVHHRETYLASVRTELELERCRRQP